MKILSSIRRALNEKYKKPNNKRPYSSDPKDYYATLDNINILCTEFKWRLEYNGLSPSGVFISGYISFIVTSECKNVITNLFKTNNPTFRICTENQEVLIENMNIKSIETTETYEWSNSITATIEYSADNIHRRAIINHGKT